MIYGMADHIFRSRANIYRTFEGGLRSILVNVFRQITAASAYNARERLQKALVKYYSAKHDFEPDVARMTKVRAANWRNHGSKEEHFGRDELALLHVATANAIPTLFWNMVFVASDPSVTEDIRKELVTIITDGARREDGKREVLIDISKFEDSCPVFVSSYRETIRLANAQYGPPVPRSYPHKTFDLIAHQYFSF